MAWFDEVKSGVRLAFVFLAGFGTLLLLVGGLHFVTMGSPANLARGSAMIVVAAAVLLLTVGLWAKWFFGACCANALRLLIVGILGRTFSAPGVPAPRSLFFAGAVIVGLMAFFSYRFTDRRPNWLDSICLLGALAAICYSLLSTEPLTWMMMGALSLAVSFAHEHLRGRKLASGAGVS